MTLPRISRLFVPQSLHRVDAGGAAGRNIRGQEGHGQHDWRDEKKRSDISRFIAAARERCAQQPAFRPR
jgi:hypothetical protein